MDETSQLGYSCGFLIPTTLTSIPDGTPDGITAYVMVLVARVQRLERDNAALQAQLDACARQAAAVAALDAAMARLRWPAAGS